MEIKLLKNPSTEIWRQILYILKREIVFVMLAAKIFLSDIL